MAVGRVRQLLATTAGRDRGNHALAPGGLALLGFALLAWALSTAFRGSLPTEAGYFVPGMVLIAAGAQLAAAALLLAAFLRNANRSTGFLAVIFACAGTVTIGLAAVVPVGVGQASALHASPQSSVWMYAAWHILVPIGALVYVALRASDEGSDARKAMRFVVMSALVAAVLAAAAIVLPVRFADAWPALVQGDSIAAFRTSGVGPAVFALCLFATIMVARQRGGDMLDSAFALAMFAITLDVGLHLANEQRFAITWYAARILTIVAPTLVIAAAIAQIFAARTGLAESLQRASQRGERHAHRLETLWKLAADTALDEPTFFRELIDAASPQLREGMPAHGVIGHFEGSEVVIDMVHDGAVGVDVPSIGDRLRASDTLVGEVLRAGRTLSWRDIRTDPHFMSRPRLRNVAWRSFIGTTFRAGGEPYFITFVSPVPLAEDFSPEDVGYVETLASLCASRLRNRAHIDRLRYQSEHDLLTGVLNRAAFRAHGFATLRAGRAVAVVVADVDRFREINDTLGHHTGDALLVELALAFARIAGDDDTFARLGGDSFGMLLYDVREPAQVEERLKRYRDAIHRPFFTGDPEHPQFERLTVSFGIAMAPHDGDDFEQLLARADAAVYAAKDAGRNRWMFAHANIQQQFAETRRLKRELSAALEEHQFELYFQPHVELATGRIAGAEALIRWNHPERGLVMPNDFIRFAEAHGFAGDIGAWVMRETVRLSEHWRAMDPGFRVWFNVSPQELDDPGLVSRLASFDGSTEGIGVEITETAAMRDVDQTLVALRAFRENGLALALDDFGTGYSSLSQLKRLEVDVLKIDRLFTAGIPHDAHDIAIVEAVVSIAEKFGFTTVAEGVETLAQVAFLASIGCTYGQGYAYARPMPAGSFDAWLHERRVSTTTTLSA